MADQDSLANFGNVTAWKRAMALLSTSLRRGWVTIAVFVFVFSAVGSLAAAFLPRMYSTQTSLLVKKNYVMPALANPKRAVPSGSEAAAQAAWESVKSRASLEEIIAANNLLARWDAERPALLKAKDWVMTRVRGPISDEDKVDALVEVLARRLMVDTSDNVVTIKTMWTDRQTALDLTNSAVAVFLESRRRFDVQTVADTLAILEKSARVAEEQVHARLAEVEGHKRRISEARAGRPLVRRAVASRPALSAAPAGDGLDEVRSGVRQATALRQALDQKHQARILELETRLAERRAVMTPRHPDVVALAGELERVRDVPAELARARSEETRLMAEYVGRGGQVDRLFEDQAARPAVIQALRDDTPQSAPESTLEDEIEADDATSYARSLLKGALETYQDLQARIGDARIELTTAEAAFQYRYSVTSPARLPRKPDSPNVILLVVAALVAGTFAGAVRAVFASLKAQALLSPSAMAAYLTAPDAVTSVP